MGKLPLIVLLLFLSNGWEQKTPDKKVTLLSAGKVLTQRTQQHLGDYTTGLKANEFSLRMNKLGGSTELWVAGVDTALSTDVTDVAVVDRSIIAYSGSPIYGIPGIFLFNFEKKKVKCIVPASHLDSAYPDGTDYFEIDRIDLNTHEIFFWHVPDVDKVDFAGDWQSGNQYRIKFDGTGLTKVRGE